MTPKRIQMSRKRPWRADHPDAVIVARPSKWGNPFTIAGAIEAGYAATQAEGRKVATEAFRDWLHGNTWAAGSDAWWEMARLHFLAGLPNLAGKELACWCPLPDPGETDWCHARVLIDLANGGAP